MRKAQMIKLVNKAELAYASLQCKDDSYIAMKLVVGEPVETIQIHFGAKPKGAGWKHNEDTMSWTRVITIDQLPSSDQWNVSATQVKGESA